MIIIIRAQQRPSGCSVLFVHKGGFTERWPATPKQLKTLEKVLRQSKKWRITPSLYDNIGFNARLIISMPVWEWFSLTTPHKAEVVAALDLASVQ